MAHFELQPEDEIDRKWQELISDSEIDPGNRAYFKELWEIDEKSIWKDSNLRRRLVEDLTFAPAIYFGLLQLLELRGLNKNPEILKRFDELADVFVGQKLASIEDRARSIQEARAYFIDLGFSEKSLQAKDLLLRAALGNEGIEEPEGERMLRKEIFENPRLRKLLEEFDREARAREEGE